MKNLRNVLLTCLLILSLALSLVVITGKQAVLAEEKKTEEKKTEEKKAEEKTPTYLSQFKGFLKGFDPKTATSNEWAEYENWVNTIYYCYGGLGLRAPYYLAPNGGYYYDKASKTLVRVKSDDDSIYYPWYKDNYKWYWGWYDSDLTILPSKPEAKPAPAPKAPVTKTSQAPQNNLIQAHMDQAQDNLELTITLSENTAKSAAGKVEVKDTESNTYLTKTPGQIKVVAYGFNGGTAYVLVNGQYQLANWQQTINNCLMFTLQAGQSFKVVK